MIRGFFGSQFGFGLSEEEGGEWWSFWRFRDLVWGWSFGTVMCTRVRIKGCSFLGLF